MKFSIIIPAYNSSATIRKTVESIVKQDVEKQIIIVDNNSTDNTYFVCEELRKEYPDVELYKCFEKGVSKARNEGMKHINGDIVGFCDADDYYDETILKKIDCIFTNNSVDIVFAGFTYVDNTRKIQFSNRKEETINTHKAIEYVLCNSPILGSVCNKFYKKEIVNNVYFDETLEYLEDGYFNVDLLSKNRQSNVYVTKENSYYYIMNSISVSNTALKAYDENGKSKYNLALYKMISNLDITNEEKNYVRDNICKLSISCANNETKNNKTIFTNLVSDIKTNYLIYIKRLFRFDVKHRIKIAIEGLLVLIKSIK